MLFRLFLIIFLMPLQSCSNTQIGEKLENSFETTGDPKISQNNTKVNEQKKLKETKKIKSEKIENDNIKANLTKENSISNNESLIKESTKSTKKVTYKPQPYRIILKLSAVDPSAPAETVTNALRKAGVQFEVEKIERFDDESFLKDKSIKR